jgi:chromosomal replication initiation ATPase DnaA
VAIYLCREVGAKPLREIGAEIGIKGAAVSLAAKRIRQRIAVDRSLRKKLQMLKDELVKISKT